MAITSKGGGSMNSYAPFNKKTINYLHKCQNSWFNVAEGG